MITLEEAIKIRNDCGDTAATDLIEYEDAYEFYQDGVDDSSIVIMKDTGEVLDLSTYYAKYDIPRLKKRKKTRITIIVITVVTAIALILSLAATVSSLVKHRGINSR